MRVASALGFVAVVASTGPVRAEPKPAVYFLEYVAPVGCPGEVTFRSQVRARTSNLAFANAEADAPRLSILIAEVDSGYLGRMSVDSGASGSTPREIEAKTCDEVVAALALTTALNFDPDAGDLRPRTPPPSSLGQPTPPRAEVLRPLPWSIGAELAATAAPSSFPAPRGGLFVDWLAARPDWTFGGGAALFYGFGKEGDSERGRVALSLLNARLSLCPLARRWVVQVSACAFGDLGILTVSGEGVPSPRSERRPWLSGGLQLWSSFPASSRWFVAAHGELSVIAVRQRFRLDDNSEIYAVGRVGGALGVAFGFRLP